MILSIIDELNDSVMLSAMKLRYVGEKGMAKQARLSTTRKTTGKIHDSFLMNVVRLTTTVRREPRVIDSRVGRNEAPILISDA